MNACLWSGFSRWMRCRILPSGSVKKTVLTPFFVSGSVRNCTPFSLNAATAAGKSVTAMAKWRRPGVFIEAVGRSPSEAMISNIDPFGAFTNVVLLAGEK